MSEDAETGEITADAETPARETSGVTPGRRAAAIAAAMKAMGQDEFGPLDDAPDAGDESGETAASAPAARGNESDDADAAGDAGNESVAEPPAESRGKTLARELRIREANRREMERVASERAAFARQTEDFARQRQHFDQQMAQLRPQLEALHMLRDNPMEGLRRIGVPFDELSRTAVQEGTPEGRIAALERQFRAELAKRDQQLSALQQERVVSQRTSSEREFIGRVSAATSPTLAAIYADPAHHRELIREAYAAEREIHEDTGRPPTQDEILAHLEKREARRYGAIKGRESAPGSAVQATAVATANRRSLDDADAATTTSATKQKSLKELTPQQRKALAIKQVQDGMRAARAAKRGAANR